MLKALFVFLLGMLICGGADAQIPEKDTVLYYMKNSGTIVPEKDSADYYLFILPPDSSLGRKAYPVTELFKNRKTKMIGHSLDRSSVLKLHGSALYYYPNGRKKSIMTYDEGVSIGTTVQYYPNGLIWKLSVKEKYIFKQTINKKEVDVTKYTILLKECRDSTGKVLTTDGNGTWLDFDKDFKYKIAEGPVVNSRENGDWHGTLSDTTGFTCTYDTGKLVGTGYGYNKNGTKYPFTKVTVQPEFKGGLEGFGKFLTRNVKFPRHERDYGISGKAITSFVVEKDGSLSDFTTIKTPSAGFGEEAIRVLKLSPKWTPGYQYGMPQRVRYTVPIAFQLGEAPPNR
jgi:hypothetical protein